MKEFIEYFCSVKEENNCRNIWLLKPPDLNRGQGIQLFNDLRIFVFQIQEYCKSRPGIAKTKSPNQLLIQQKTQIKNIIISFPANRGDLTKSK